MHTSEHTVGGVTLEAIVGDHCTRPLLEGVWYEQRLLNYVRALDLAGTYVDVGAFIGNHSSFFARCTKARRVVAVEGNPAVLPVLERNAERNGFEVMPAVIEGAEHHLYNIDTPVPGNMGMSKPEPCADGKLVGIGLAEVLSELDDVTLIKIDVEGSTPDVLSTPEMLAWFYKQRPTLIIEARTADEQEAITAILRPFGYNQRARSLASSPTYHWSVNP